EKYVSVLTQRLAQERLKLTLVDGFSGGGLYLHPKTNEPIPGSPLIMLSAMSKARSEAQAARTKSFLLDVEYFFVEKSKPTIEFLKAELQNAEVARDQAERISVIQGEFSSNLGAMIRRIEERGTSRRVIFVLDQYGYSDV